MLLKIYLIIGLVYAITTQMLVIKSKSKNSEHPVGVWLISTVIWPLLIASNFDKIKDALWKK